MADALYWFVMNIRYTAIVCTKTKANSSVVGGCFQVFVCDQFYHIQNTKNLVKNCSLKLNILFAVYNMHSRKLKAYSVCCSERLKVTG